MDSSTDGAKSKRGKIVVIGAIIALVIIIIMVIVAYFLLSGSDESPVADPSYTDPGYTDSQPPADTSPPVTPPAPSYVPPPVAVVPSSTRTHTSWIDPSGKLGLTELRQGEAITSPNKQYAAVVQSDGNFVVYTADGKARWNASSNASGGPFTVQFAGDGQLVVMNAAGSAIWSNKKSGSNVALVMQDDGNLVVYQDPGASSMKPIWHCC